MKTNETTKSVGRNWLLTIACVPLTALFAYLMVGVWFVDVEGSSGTEIYGRLVISVLSAYATFIFGRIVVRGHTARGGKRTLEDVVTSGL